MSKRNYGKPALTFEKQIEHLKDRGMQFHDQDEALRQLSSISYYRLSGYWFLFRKRTNNGQPSDKFLTDTTFDEVMRLYEFDRQLRSKVLDGIERIEVAIRTRLTYHLGHKYGAFGYINPENFHPGFSHEKWLKTLLSETERSSDEFIRHFQKSYNGFPIVPIWMQTEVMTFGSLAWLYKGMKNNAKEGIRDKEAISGYFGLHYKRLENWLRTLTYIRNVCAHHSRLWNRELAIHPKKMSEPEWQPPLTPRLDRTFTILLILRYLMRQSGNGDHWAEELTDLIRPIAENDAYRKSMGMPENWEEHPLWK